MSTKEAKQVCGIVMPISSIDGCSESHWSDVLDIITEATESVGFEANLVSNADDAGIIHKRIIQNLHDNPIVVCDVSRKNPNVMFELGMRLAFDKPTIIIKDDKTSYSFDTSSIEHIEYPRDLRFSKIIEFKQKLADKIKATHERATTDQSYTTFLKHFGEFKVAKLDKKEVTGQEFIIEELRGLRMGMRRLERLQFSSTEGTYRKLDNLGPESDVNICLKNKDESEAQASLELIKGHPAVKRARLLELGTGHWHLLADLHSQDSAGEIERLLGKPARRRIRNPVEKP